MMPRTPAEAAMRFQEADATYNRHFIDSIQAGDQHAIMFVDGTRETLTKFRDYNGVLYTDTTYYAAPGIFRSVLTVHLDKGKYTFSV